MVLIRIYIFVLISYNTNILVRYPVERNLADYCALNTEIIHNAIPNTAMYKWRYFIIFGFSISLCFGAEPFKPRYGSVPFLVYFGSRQRAICVGTLVSRTAVLTAAICVVDPATQTHDTRPINVVTGATYRHPRRGIRVQVTKIIIPKLSNVTGERAYMVHNSPAVLLLARKVPDVLAEIPLRSLAVDYKLEDALSLHEECFMAGWHFFYKGDKIYPVHKFLLQRNIRVQYLIVVKKALWCSAIDLKFQKAMTSFGYTGQLDKAVSICIRDGMYGAPLICRGKAVGMMTTPHAQWENCTGHSNLVHMLNSHHIRKFMTCVSSLFEPEFNLSWEALKKSLDSNGDSQFDYLPDVYDRMLYGMSSSEEV